MFAGIADEGLGRNEGGPADTPAWEPEIEAPASMQMAVEAPASMRYALRAWLCARARCIRDVSEAARPRGALDNPTESNQSRKVGSSTLESGNSD